MRRQPFWVVVQALYSRTTLLSPRVWPFSKGPEFWSLGFPLQVPTLLSLGTDFRELLSAEPTKNEWPPPHLLTPSSLFAAHSWPGMEDYPSPTPYTSVLGSVRHKPCECASFVWAYQNCAFIRNGPGGFTSPKWKLQCWVSSGCKCLLL